MVLKIMVGVNTLLSICALIFMILAIYHNVNHWMKALESIL